MIGIPWTLSVGAFAAALVALVLALRWSPFHGCQRGTTMIVLGSGGHTAEMLQLLKGVVSGRGVGTKRVYVVAKTDGLSARKAIAFEQSLRDSAGTPLDAEPAHKYEIEYIDRAREVGQSYLTSVISTLYSLLTTARLIVRTRPGMLLVNGPGTCLPVVVWARVFGGGCKVYYIESIARVDRLSLTGRVLTTCGGWLVNGGFYVQWQELAQKMKGKAKYVGRVY